MESKNKESGFTLIEIMLVLAIGAILAASILPDTIKMRMFSFYNTEQVQLSNLSIAFKEYVNVNKDIPGAATWLAKVAKHSDLSISKVQLNVVNANRILIYPDNFIATASTLPYNQTTRLTAGSFLNAVPVNPRVMIVSNLGKTPLTAVSGALAFASFDNIWNQTGAFAAEMTESDSLIIKRINLSSEFKKVVLNNNDAALATTFSIDGLPVATSSILSNSSSIFYVLKSSMIELYDQTPVISYMEVANNDISFVFNSVWGGTLGGSGGAGGSGGSGAASGGGAILQAAPAFSTAGVLTNWGIQPSCTPTGTTYILTVINNNLQGDLNAFSGLSSGLMTFLGKIKKTQTVSYGVPECAIVAVVPQDPQSLSLGVFYMPHSNFTYTAN